MVDPNKIWDKSKIEHKRAMMRLDAEQQLADLEVQRKMIQPQQTQQLEPSTGMIDQGNFDMFNKFRISQNFGNYNPGLYAGRTQGSRHYGVDIATPEGTPVYSPVAGNIERGQSPDFGNYARVTGPDGTTYQFSHLKNYGDGNIIGYTGNTGHSTGPHLDIMAKRNGQYIDPTKLESLKRAI